MRAVAELALDVAGVSKSFNGKTVLGDVSLSVHAGEIRGLVGANGAGKSTLIKTISGFHAPDGGGHLSIGGATVSLPASARELMASGARFVHQDLGLIPSLTIAENFTLEPGLSGSTLAPRGVRKERAQCASRLRRLGVAQQPGSLVADLGVSEQVMVAVVRAVTDPAGPTTLLVLDEATSGLPRDETRVVLDLIRRTASEEVGVLFVSHRLDEVLDVCETITVMRDGRVVETMDREERPGSWTLDHLSRAMFGPEATSAIGRGVPSSSVDTSPAARLRVKNLRGHGVHGISFQLHAGEILGITGLVNSGGADVGRILFGAPAPESGELWMDGQPYWPHSPRYAKRNAVAYVPASRDLSLLKTLSVTENATLADLRAFGLGRLRLGDERQATRALLEQFKVSPPEPALTVGTLSGGNQQKVALLKWLRCRPLLLILDEPCRGVDISARRAIYEILRDATRQAVSVLVITSEVEEAVELCDRVLVMQDGEVTHEFSRPNVTPEALIKALNPVELNV